ncbi:MAG: 4-(cytidine 5'-diphospho)-2-C-methyl-D-erythritol kinase [Thermodesulfobacteriota bacterium]
MSSRISVAAPAKINLSLQVVAKLASGFHELDSWMVKLALADRLDLNLGAGEGISLHCPGTDLPEGPDNLVWQAADAFFAEIGRQPAVDILLHKHIPVAAGLGGGSSDAAAVLTGLNRYFGKQISERRLMEMGLGLGADVPFFISPLTSARARGVGEILTPLPPLSDIYYLLLNPGFQVATAWVFANLKPPYSKDLLLSAISENSSGAGNYALTMGGKTTILGRAETSDRQHLCLQNDLETVTANRYPDIDALKSLLMAQGACYAAMSGSGPTLFGIFTERERAIGAEQTMRQELPFARIFLTEPAGELS